MITKNYKKLITSRLKIGFILNIQKNEEHKDTNNNNSYNTIIAITNRTKVYLRHIIIENNKKQFQKIGAIRNGNNNKKTHIHIGF